MKVSELEGALLDYWVAMAEGFGAELCGDDRGAFCIRTKQYAGGGSFRGPFCPSTEWTDGGPIIERERIGLMPYVENGVWGWMAALRESNGGGKGPTPLIAAMRALVASKFGDLLDEVPHD